MPLDPVTAAMNAFASFNQFLCTPPGQKLATATEAVVQSLLQKFDVHLTPATPATPK